MKDSAPLRAAVAVAVLAVGAATAGRAAATAGRAAGSVPGAPAAPDAPATLSLASQTPWVTPGQEYQLRVLLTPDPGPSGRLTVTVYSSVPNRTDFTRTLDDHLSGESVLTRPLTVPLSGLVPDAAGARVIRIPTQDPAQPRDRSRLQLPRSGVFPVRVAYQPDGGGPERVFVTHLIYVAGPLTGPKLSLAWIVPVHAPPHPGPDGTDVLTQAESDDLAALSAGLNAHPDVPIVLAPTPDTLNALATSPREQDRSTLATLAQPQQQRQLVAGTYVPVSLPGLLAGGLSDDATLQLTRGNDTLANALSVRPDGRTWVEEGPIDQNSAAFLRGAQVDRLVVPDDALSPNPLPITLAQPFDVLIRTGSRIRAAAADPGLASHFAPTSDPVLAAHQLLADLAVVYLDRPGQTRGVVIDTPRTWRPDDRFLGTFLDGLATSPLATPVTLDTLFSRVPAATVGRNTVMTRTLISDARVPRDVAGLPVEGLRAAHRRVDAFGSALTEDNPLYSQLESMVLVAESADLGDLRARQAQLAVLNGRIDTQLALVQLPTSRRITLTARTGHLPVTILSGADYPLRVVLRLQSDKLSFPNSSGGTATQTLELHRGNNPVQLTVRARTPASFPLHISLLSPDGRLVLSSTTFTVQSTALSGVGLGLTVGAALFLAVWWTRQVIRSRSGKRNRRMIQRPGTDEPAPHAGARPLSAVPDTGPLVDEP